MPSSVAAPPVAIRVDALSGLGVGHLVRQLALAEEFATRGRRVRLFGRTDVAWAAAQVSGRGLTLEEADADPDAFAARVIASGSGLCVIDGYDIGAELGTALRAAGVVVGTLVDGMFGLDQDADVYVDQNLGAVAATGRYPGRLFLVGSDYVLLRDLVRDRRSDARPRRQAAPRVLVVFGGTDPFDGCRTTVPLLLATGVPLTVAAVAARQEVADALRALRLGPGQVLEVYPPVDDLPGLAASCDAAVSASGSSVWELACLGVPTGLVCVVDNQRLGYREATRELCLPVGELATLRAEPAARARAIGVLRRLVSQAPLRAELSARGALEALERGRRPV
jgi:spore coat polysaccharide biosynthesis predicted glycosyltransferase SpsG